MTYVVWRIGTDTPDYTADDLSGAGAKITGGRWNRQGNAILYTSENISLACLETLVHLKAGGLPLNRYLVKIEIPDQIHNAAKQCSTATAPIGWDAMPAGKVSLDFGDQWLGSGISALLIVPSAIAPEESNILINPAHPDSKQIQASKMRKWTYDPRLMKNP